MSKTVFTMCPLKPEYDDLYHIIKQISDELGSKAIRVDDYFTTKPIIQHIHDSIQTADVIVCDISDTNGNVMYELGIAHALGKPTIQICRNDAPIPFDVADIWTIIYDRKNLLKSLKRQLLESMKIALENPERWTLKRVDEESSNRHLFISYSHKDKEILDRLLIHLKPLDKEGVVDLWVDTKIAAGEKWKIKIEQSLRSARVAILLVSADFLASDFIIDNELPPLLSAAEAKGTRIIPVIAKPCRFSRDKNLSSFQSINDPKEPLIKMNTAKQEETYDKVSELIESYMRKE